MSQHELATWRRECCAGVRHNGSAMFMVLYNSKVEQQGKTFEEIQAQWYDPNYWSSIHGHVDEIDTLIDSFNAQTGLLENI